MFGSEVLEVAIGLAFVYLLLSLLTSTVNEWIAQVLALRARTLEDGLRNLLDDPHCDQLADAVYRHPLVASLGRREWFSGLLNRQGKPSYIPSRVFARALLDVIARPPIAPPAQPAREPAPIAVGIQAGAAGAAPADGVVAPPDSPAPPSSPAPTALTIDEIRRSVHLLPYPEVRRALLALLDDAQHDLDALRRNVECWFDDTMDRVSGWYKRQVQWIILGVALVASAILNVDTIALGNSLWVDPALRSASAAAAERYVQQQPAADDASLAAQIDRIDRDLRQLQLPIGWSTAPGDPRAFPQSVEALVGKLVGLAVTTFAVSLGAPFWFDVLSKIVTFRSTGKPPEDTRAR